MSSMSNGDYNFKNLQMQINNIEDKLDSIEKKVPTKEEMELANERLIKKVIQKADERYATADNTLTKEEADENYASKKVEKALYVGAGSILLWAIKSILSLI